MPPQAQSVTAAAGIDRILSHAVDSGQVPGVVALAADARGVLYQGAFGTREIGSDTPMTLDTIFGIASMNKPINVVAALQLVEQDRLSLDEPAGGHVPELAAAQVLDGFEPDGTPRLRPPRRPITPRHLLTHTSGLAYAVWNRDIHKFQQHTGVPVTLANAPLAFDPGEDWSYGYGIDGVARVVEHVTGQPAVSYIREHILDPLGMVDTFRANSADLESRAATVHRRAPDGTLTADRRVPSGSTGPDYIRFLRMLLGGGQLEGIRILREETVAKLGQNQLAHLRPATLQSAVPETSHDLDLLPGLETRWGFGGLINTTDKPGGRSAGSWAWAGINNTYFWVDPVRDITGVLLTQILPFGDPGALDLLDQFERATYASAANRSKSE